MLILARHGETRLNKDRYLQGSRNMELTDKGILQAERISYWAQHQNVRRVLSSSSSRAQMTAQIITNYLSLPLTIHEELCERNYGIYDNMSIDLLIEKRRKLGHKFVDSTQDWFAVSDVESDTAVFERVSSLIKTIYPCSSDENVLIITHAGVIKSYLHTSFEISSTRSNFVKVPNGAVILIDYDIGKNIQLRGFYPEL